jgi:hypothetical protein
LIQVSSPFLVSTAVKTDGQDILCRLYSVARQDEPVIVKTKVLDIQGIYTLSGERVSGLKPFKIGKIVFKPFRGAGG